MLLMAAGGECRLYMNVCALKAPVLTFVERIQMTPCSSRSAGTCQRDRVDGEEMVSCASEAALVVECPFAQQHFLSLSCSYR